MFLFFYVYTLKLLYNNFLTGTLYKFLFTFINIILKYNFLTGKEQIDKRTNPASNLFNKFDWLFIKDGRIFAKIGSNLAVADGLLKLTKYQKQIFDI